MFYRENGQFKTTYRADQQILPIRQDRIVMALLLVFAVAVVPMLASDYFFRAILIPFLIMSLAALGVSAGFGSDVTLWGRAANGTVLSIDEVARAAGTVGYELMCALAPRVPVLVAD